MTNVLEYRGRIQTLREGKKTYVFREAVEVNNWLQSVPELRAGEEKNGLQLEKIRFAFIKCKIIFIYIWPSLLPFQDYLTQKLSYPLGVKGLVCVKQRMSRIFLICIL